MKGPGFLESLVPSRFEVVRLSGSLLAIRRDAGPRLRELALAPARERAHGGTSFMGRGQTQRVEYDAGNGTRAVFRRYRHGGLLRWLTRDKLLDAARPFRELEVVERARAKGVPTVEVLAVRVDRIGLFLYAGEMVTREIEDAPDLLHWLAGEALAAPAVRRQVAHVLGEAVARMHGAGILHSDLHLKNLLLRLGDPPEAFVIDLDKASRTTAGGLPVSAALSNLRRLDRSVEKYNLLDHRCITRQDRLRFLDAYLAVNPGGLTRRQSVRRLRRRYPFRRLKWQILRWWRGGARPS